MAAIFQLGNPKRKFDDDDKEKPIIAKTPTELQRLRLEKLMKHPDKPVPIPERPKEKNTPHVPDFVRNVMGSSAGAGSGEFHVYRHLRRKEYARQKFIQEKAEKDTLEDDYHKKLEENRKAAEEKTAKKRAKRLKKKQKLKGKKKQKITAKTEVKSESEESDKEEEDDDVSQIEDGNPERSVREVNTVKEEEESQDQESAVHDSQESESVRPKSEGVPQVEDEEDNGSAPVSPDNAGISRDG